MWAFIDLLLKAILGAVVGLLVQSMARTPQLLRRRHLRLLLNFPQDKPLIFVYPPRWNDEPFVLPRTSTEDFMAMNNMISALLSVGWDSEGIVLRDCSRFADELELSNNIVVFCSPKSNTLANKIQSKLLEANVKYYHFVEVSIGGSEKQWAISDGHGYYPSSAAITVGEYEAKSQALRAETGAGASSLPEANRVHEMTLVDVASITKVRNPWHPEKQILLIAGVRGIGTWGAAETLKKWHDGIYRRKKGWLDKSRKHRSFSALLEIHYRNSDIIKTELLGLIDIEDQVQP